MRVVFESWDDFFSDEGEMMLFGIGPYAPLPPQYTYIKKNGDILDCYGVYVGHADTEEEFRQKYEENYKIAVV